MYIICISCILYSPRPRGLAPDGGCLGEADAGNYHYLSYFLVTYITRVRCHTSVRRRGVHGKVHVVFIAVNLCLAPPYSFFCVVHAYHVVWLNAACQCTPLRVHLCSSPTIGLFDEFSIYPCVYDI